MTAFHRKNVKHRLMAAPGWTRNHQDPAPTLSPPRIPQAESSNGIGYDDIFESSGYLGVLIPTYTQIKLYDTIDVFWDGFHIATEMVSPEDLVAPGIFIDVPVDTINDGMATVHYLVTSTMGANQYKSHPLTIRVKTTVPGDPDPDTPINEKLKPVGGLPDDITASNIESIQAILPRYPNMQSGDTYRLRWGGEVVTNTVEESEVGRDVLVDIPPELIMRAGLGKKEIDYDIFDEVNNWSKRSEKFEVNVKYAGELLDAPSAPNVVDGILDLALLGSDDVNVNVSDSRLINNESVLLSWVIYPLIGDPVEHTFTEVKQPNVPLVFEVPNGVATASGDSSVVLRYELLSDPRQYSRSVTFQVLPIVKQYAMPEIREAQNSHLDIGQLTSEGASVLISAWPGMAENDWVEVYVFGYDANNALFYHYQPSLVSQTEAGSQLERSVPRAYFNPLPGGRLEVYYSVNGVKSSEQGYTVVGAPAPLLIAPDVPGVEDYELDPDEVPNGTQVEVKDYVRKAVGDTITMSWVGSGAVWTHDEKVTDQNLNDPIRFNIDYALIIGNINRLVDVSYQVKRAGGGSDSSEIFPILVRRKGVEQFEAPAVLQAESDGVTLNPANVINGATVEVAFVMKATDSIKVTFSGGSEATTFISEAQAGSGGLTKLQFTVPAHVIGASQNTTVDIYYSVIRDDNPYQSKSLQLKVTDLLDSHFLSPEMPDSREGVLYPRFGESPNVTQQRWPLIGAFQLYWIKVEGMGIDGTPRQFYAASARPVTVEEAAKGLSVTLPIDTLLTLKNRSELKITVKVAFDRNSDESKARSLPPLTLILQTPLQQLAVENVTDYRYDLDMKDFITAEYVNVTVPMYREMESGDEVVLYWRTFFDEEFPAYFDSQRVVEAGPLDFKVPRRYLMSAIGRSATVAYRVEKGDFQQWSADQFIDVVSQSLELKPAEYLRATQQVRVSYEGQKAGHTVQVRWDGVKVRHTNFKPVSNGAPTLFVMDRLWITENIGKQVFVNYTVNSDEGELLFSKVMIVQL